MEATVTIDLTEEIGEIGPFSFLTLTVVDENFAVVDYQYAGFRQNNPLTLDLNRGEFINHKWDFDNEPKSLAEASQKIIELLKANNNGLLRKVQNLFKKFTKIFG